MTHWTGTGTGTGNHNIQKTSELEPYGYLPLLLETPEPWTSKPRLAKHFPRKWYALKLPDPGPESISCQGRVHEFGATPPPEYSPRVSSGTAPSITPSFSGPTGTSNRVNTGTYDEFFVKLKTRTLDSSRSSCDSRDAQQLLADLNALMNTKRSLSEQGVLDDLECCISRGLDFGTVFGLLRTRWEYQCLKCQDSTYSGFLDTRYGSCVCALCTYAWLDAPLGGKSAGEQTITEPYSRMPRRMWDLCSNRVVPLEAMIQPRCRRCYCPGAKEQGGEDHSARVSQFMAVSHTWTDDMTPAVSDINQRQWEILLPKGISLDLVRNQLLGLGAQYAWLDVLCLRQQALRWPALEECRKSEWKTDVPTMGNVYRKAMGVLRYFNGLGRELKTTGWDNERHWLNRAWTLQEIRPEGRMFTGGVPPHILLPMNLMGEVTVKCNAQSGSKDTKALPVKVRKRLRDLISPLAHIALEAETQDGCSVLSLTHEMARRFSREELDKIAGIGYLLRAPTLPTYTLGQSPEDAWKRCVTHMPYLMKLEILFNYPYPRLRSPPPEELKGDRLCWLPTWKQMMALPEPNFHPRRPKCPPEFQPIPLRLEAYSFQMVEYRAGIVIMRCEIQRLPDITGNTVTEFRVTPLRLSCKSASVSAGFYSPYPTALQDGDNYILVAQGNHTEVQDCTWLVCQELQSDGNIKRDHLEATLEDKGIILDRGALVLEKHAILMTDDARVLLAPKNVTMETFDLKTHELNHDVLVEPVCYFI